MSCTKIIGSIEESHSNDTPIENQTILNVKKYFHKNKEGNLEFSSFRECSENEEEITLDNMTDGKYIFVLKNETGVLNCDFFIKNQNGVIQKYFKKKFYEKRFNLMKYVVYVGTGGSEYYSQPISFSFRFSGSKKKKRNRFNFSLTMIENYVLKGKWKFSSGFPLYQSFTGHVYYGTNIKTGNLICIKEIDISNSSFFRTENNKVVKRILKSKTPPAGSNKKIINFPNDKEMELIAKNEEEQKKIQLEIEEKIRKLSVEISVLQNLNSNHIVKYYGLEFNKEKNLLFLFFQFINGGTLFPLLQKYCLTESLIRVIVIQLLKGMMFLHEKGIIIRDISSNNVLFDDKGQIYISDFGLTKFLVSNITGKSMFIGNEDGKSNKFAKRKSNSSFSSSIHYFAPEVLDGKPFTKESDIWSLGLLILEMICRKPPFHEARKRCKDNKEFFNFLPKYLQVYQIKIPKNVPPKMKDFIQKCVARDSSKRPNALSLLKHSWLNENSVGESQTEKEVIFVGESSDQIKMSKMDSYIFKTVSDILKKKKHACGTGCLLSPIKINFKKPIYENFKKKFGKDFHFHHVEEKTKDDYQVLGKSEFKFVCKKTAEIRKKLITRTKILQNKFVKSQSTPLFNTKFLKKTANSCSSNDLKDTL